MHEYYAAEALGNSGAPEAVEILKELLEAQSILVRKNAIIALGKIKSASSSDLAQRMVGILRDPQVGMLAPFAADTLGVMGPTALPAVLEMLDSKSSPEVFMAIRAVNAMPSSEASVNEKLIGFLDSTDNSLREQAIVALGKKQVKQAVPKLIDALKDPNEQISLSAVRALGDIRDRQAIEPVQRLYNRDYATFVVYWIREAQDTALKKLTGEKESRSDQEWRAWTAKP